MTGPFTRGIFDAQGRDDQNNYYTFINVNYDEAKGDHWVGVTGMSQINGKQYVSISGTSKNDVDGVLGKGSRSRMGWISSTDNGKTTIFVPVDQIKAYVTFSEWIDEN